MQRGRRNEARAETTTHVTKCTTGTYVYDRSQQSLTRFFRTGSSSALRNGVLWRTRARMCPAAHKEPPMVARLEGHRESALRPRDEREPSAVRTGSSGRALSASGGCAPFDPRGTCQQGATQRDLHPTTSVNRRQALCVWLRAESRPIRQANAQKAEGREGGHATVPRARMRRLCRLRIFPNRALKELA